MTDSLKRNPVWTLLAVLTFVVPATSLAQPSVSLSGKTYSPAKYKPWDADPRLSMTMSSHYYALDGRAYAREYGADRYFESSQMEALDLPDNFGISQIVFYEIGMDWRPTRRNHFTITYLWGQAVGEGSIQDPTGFNDHYFTETGSTDSMISLDSLQLGWYYRAYDSRYSWGSYSLDLGAGAQYMRSYVSFGAQDTKGVRYDTESITAPLVPYLMVRNQWQPRPDRSLALELQASPVGLENPLLTDMPAQAFSYRAKLYGTRPLTSTMNLQAGLEWWDQEIDFDGIEDDGDLAENEIELWMAGGFVGVTFDDPHEAVISALRTLLR